MPVRSLSAIGRARPGDAPWTENGGPATYLYTREVVDAGSAFHARMFAGGWGVAEDPATGSAAAAFAGVTLAFDRPADGEHVLTIEQGFEMGAAEPHRPVARRCGRGVALGLDRRLGGDRLERRARPVSPKPQVLKVAELDFVLEPARWAFAETEGAADRRRTGRR